MSKLGMCGIACALLSVWGIIQLVLMGIFYHMEAVLLIEDVHAHKYDSYDDFLKLTEANFNKTAINCYIAAAIYVVFLGLSIYCIKYSNRKDLLQKELMEDQDYACRLVDEELTELTEEQKKKIK